MSKITLNLLFKKKSIIMPLFILCSFYTSEKAFSIKLWTRETVSVTHDAIKNKFTIKFEILDYEFGSWGEYAYFDWCFFLYSLNRWDYSQLISCGVNFQVQNKINKTSPIEMRHKLSGAIINLFGYKELNDNKKMDGIFWAEGTQQKVECENISNKAYLTFIWNVPAGIEVKDILIAGKWDIRGLYCVNVFFVKIYDKNDGPKLKITERTDSDLNYDFEKPDNNKVQVFTDGEAVVIKGARDGEDVKLYTTSGNLVKSIIADGQIVKLKLPVNQIYFVNVAQVRFKVALCVP